MNSMGLSLIITAELNEYILQFMCLLTIEIGVYRSDSIIFGKERNVCVWSLALRHTLIFENCGEVFWQLNYE